MAMMTENEIERFFYRKVKEGPLGQEIGGEVYRRDERPDGSMEEDAVVSFLSGRDGQEQSGIVIVNVYVPDIPDSSGRMVRDKVRTGEIESIAGSLPSLMNGDELYVWKEETPHTVKVDEIKQHAVTIRLNFKLITD